MSACEPNSVKYGEGWNDDQPEPPVDLDALEQIVHDLWDGPTGDGEITSVYRQNLRAAIAELRELRAWRARLGWPAGWFPEKCLARDPWHGERHLYADLRDELQELQIACKSLLGRAKETEK